MEPKQAKHASKFLSLILRHRPEVVNVELDEKGWIDVNELLTAIQQQKEWYTREVLDRVVANNDKQRFEFNKDQTRIRARQGHSVKVDLGYVPRDPPDVLYHGTAEKNLKKIRKQGLRRMNRHHVHLSVGKETAQTVGRRHGTPVVLVVDALRMHKGGYEFFVTENGVWLTENVPKKFIKFQ